MIAIEIAAPPTLGRDEEEALGEDERPTLRVEIAEILRESGAGWRTTQWLADQVNERNRNRKRDRSAVTAFQVHGRTRNHPELFERDGSRVKLRDDAAPA